MLRRVPSEAMERHAVQSWGTGSCSDLTASSRAGYQHGKDCIRPEPLLSVREPYERRHACVARRTHEKLLPCCWVTRDVADVHEVSAVQVVDGLLHLRAEPTAAREKQAVGEDSGRDGLVRGPSARRVAIDPACVVEKIADITRSAIGRDRLGVPNNAVLVEDHGGAVGHALVAEEDAVRTRDAAVRAEV